MKVTTQSKDKNFSKGEFLMEAQSVGTVGPNTLVNGDCLEMMKLIQDDSVDMVLADPPYG